MTCLPTDLDLFGHMNNGRYLTLFDLGRFDTLIRAGVWDVVVARGWLPVVAAGSVTFRKSVTLWQRFDIETRLIAADERALYVEHRAVVRGEIYARLIARGRFVKRAGGVVRIDELLDAIGASGLELPRPEGWMVQWIDGSALPSTKANAPSTWT